VDPPQNYKVSSDLSKIIIIIIIIVAVVVFKDNPTAYVGECIVRVLFLLIYHRGCRSMSRRTQALLTIKL
jgi:hypothetical protein